MGTTFSKEFKEQIVELHRKGGRTFMDIAKEFSLSPTTVASWVRAADTQQAAQARSQAAGQGGGESDKQKVRRLERELARKEEELQVLGKALAFFARRAEP